MGAWRKAVLGLLLATVAGCAVDGLDPRATRELHWFGLHSHTDLDGDTRWRVAPDARIALVESAPADPAWLQAARDGFYDIFPMVEQADSDFVVRIIWPSEKLLATRDAQSHGFLGLGRLIPDASDPVTIQLALIDLHLNRPVKTSSLTVDPHLFSSSGERPEQIRASFRHYAASLTGSH